MQLKDFVEQTFTQIIDGVKASQKYGAKNGAQVNPSQKTTYVLRSSRSEETRESDPKAILVDFDIALVSEDGTQRKGGLGVFLGSIGAGAQTRSDQAITATTRVKFSIPFIPPVQYVNDE